MVCVWADSRAVRQPTPSLCLCANAVLKWAHYHQREHKHSSRKQDSLCQEREPLPPAYCRPDDITSLKIRQWGSYYYCRHAPQAHTTEDNPTWFFLMQHAAPQKSSTGLQVCCLRAVQCFSSCSIFPQFPLKKIIHSHFVHVSFIYLFVCKCSCPCVGY